MGLKMEDIHTPSVASASANGHSEAASGSQKSLLDLITEKDKIEAELSALSSVLDSHRVNMSTSLTTFDGYPRDDLDIAQIRTTRARIIHLRNDYKAIMSKIETGLHDHHAVVKADGATPSVSTSSLSANPTMRPARPAPDTSNLPEAAFAKVNSVVTRSPADDAGMKAGDEVLRFGNVNFMNHEKLSKVAETVQQNQGRMIVVKVARRDGNGGNVEILNLQLTPRLNWGGRGLLGCHLLPA